jgi:hypothetical protein
MKSEFLDPQSLIEDYGREAKVIVGDSDRPITLGTALDIEAFMCTVEETTRQDPAKRLAFLAKILEAGGTLRPEHRHLLDRAE